MLKNRLNILGGKIVPSYTPSGPTPVVASKKVTANYIPSTAGSPMNVAMFGGPSFQTLFSGILPDTNERAMIPYYRDMYYYDPVAGATVDIMSSFPFSDLTLVGLDNEELTPFADTCARLNVRSLTQEISLSYLVDGDFAGTLVYDKTNKVFQDVLMHDSANILVSTQPFYSLDPVITVNTAQQLNQYLNNNSPFLESVLGTYPRNLIDVFRSGSVVLDPLTTLYLARRGAKDRTAVSYLKRLLPIYMLEKILYRGTLIEATKRQRSTSHVTAGDDVWEPTVAEMNNLLAQFQQTELDPLGAWIITRNGVNVNEIRQAGDIWKWNDVVDGLTPLKLRALGTSEAFLSGDASYGNAEAAISVFMDNADSYRQFLTYKIFTTKIFPIIAVFHGLYKDKSRAKPPNSAANIMFNAANYKNLKIPTVRWHKPLMGNDYSSQLDMLEKLSEKGFTVPLKMWAAAAGVEISSLIADLEEDRSIKEKIAQITGKNPDAIGESQESEEEMFASVKPRDTKSKVDGSYSAKDKGKVRRVPLLAREMPDSGVYRVSKSGNKKHTIFNERKASARMNDILVAAVKALNDPNHRESVRKKVDAKVRSMAMDPHSNRGK